MCHTNQPNNQSILTIEEYIVHIERELLSYALLNTYFQCNLQSAVDLIDLWHAHMSFSKRQMNIVHYINSFRAKIEWKIFENKYIRNPQNREKKKKMKIALCLCARKCRKEAECRHKIYLHVKLCKHLRSFFFLHFHFCVDKSLAMGECGDVDCDHARRRDRCLVYTLLFFFFSMSHIV